jgi:phosphoribosylanthranilate isomerase
MPRIKIGGITNLDDAQAAVAAGADALGFVFAPSPRRVEVAAARDIIRELPALVTTVGVFVDEDAETVRRVVEEAGLAMVQLHGAEPPEFLEQVGASRAIKAFRLRAEADLAVLPAYGAARAWLLDTYVPGHGGGTGTTFNWEWAAGIAGRPIILAGGLRPENVAEAVRVGRPYAVDVSSGVEARPGKKDHYMLRDFVAAARGA